MLNKSSSVTDIYPTDFLWAIQSAHLSETSSFPIKGKHAIEVDPRELLCNVFTEVVINSQ